MKISNRTKKLVRNIVIICALFVTASSFYSVISRIGECKKQIKVLNEQLITETEKNKELNETKKQIHSDSNYKKIARDTLGLVNPGDKVYVDSNSNEK